MYKFLPVFLFLAFVSEMKSQQFQISIGGASAEEARGICSTSDGGYIVVGSTASFGAGGQDAYVVKINSTGAIVWSKTYGGAAEDRAVSAFQTADGNLVILGNTKSFGAGGSDFYLIKTDANGNLIWSKTYGDTADETTESVCLTSNGGYAILGTTMSSSSGYNDIYVVSADSLGVEDWSARYATNGWDGARTMLATSDNGFILSGFVADSLLAYDRSTFLIKIDSAGSIQWHKTYSDAAGLDLIKTVDGGYMISGYDQPSAPRAVLLKTDSLGNVQWSTKFNGSVTVPNRIILANDGGYVMAGAVYPGPFTGPDFVLQKTNSAGVFQWAKRFDVADIAAGLCAASDNGYAFVGTNTGSLGNIYMIKADSAGGSCYASNAGYAYVGPGASLASPLLYVHTAFSTSQATPPSAVNSGGTATMSCYVGINESVADEDAIRAFPNPTNGKFYFSNLQNNSTIQIYGCAGELILQTVLKVKEEGIDLSNKKRGIYFYRIKDQKGEVSSGRIILQ